ncbi:MAG: rod shape-determining protein MreD [Ignavibacteria bacterium]|nr:rod shape-determining protein MreD [Ignavibacteria bacterium]
MKRFLLYCALSIALLLVHLMMVPFLALANVVPDIVLIFVIVLAVMEGRMAATIAGFCLGLLLDLLAGESSVLGLSALAKSVTGFAVGYSFSEGRALQTLGSYRFLVIVGAGALLHNALYFTIYLQGTSVSFVDAIVFHAVPGALYTMLISVIPMFFFSRQQPQ